MRLKKKKKKRRRYSGRSLALWHSTVLSELFLSEGKGQVYGTIHGLFTGTPGKLYSTK